MSPEVATYLTPTLISGVRLAEWGIRKLNQLYHDSRRVKFTTPSLLALATTCTQHCPLRHSSACPQLILMLMSFDLRAGGQEDPFDHGRDRSLPQILTSCQAVQ